MAVAAAPTGFGEPEVPGDDVPEPADGPADPGDEVPVPEGGELEVAGADVVVVPPLPLGAAPVAVGIVSMYCCTPDAPGTFGGAFEEMLPFAYAVPPAKLSRRAVASSEQRKLERMLGVTGRLL